MNRLMTDYLAAACLFAAFGLPFVTGAAQFRPKPAPARAPAARRPFTTPVL
jgi:hypothetical protein